MMCFKICGGLHFLPKIPTVTQKHTDRYTKTYRPLHKNADYISYRGARKKSPLCTHLDEIVSTSYSARFCEVSSHPRGALWWCESHLLFTPITYEVTAKVHPPWCE